MNKIALIFNLFGQDKVDSDFVLSYYRHIPPKDKVVFSSILADLIIQNRCTLGDVNLAIKESGVKQTANSVVVLRKGIHYHNLLKLFQIREVDTSVLLLVHLFRIGYNRMRVVNRNKEKWWYNDLSTALLETINE